MSQRNVCRTLKVPVTAATRSAYRKHIKVWSNAYFLLPSVLSLFATHFFFSLVFILFKYFATVLSITFFPFSASIPPFFFSSLRVCALMEPHGVFQEPTRSQPSGTILRSIYALYWKDTFLGSCVAIAETVLISAGHHFNARQDDVGDFSVLVKESRWVRVQYVAKNSTHDLLVLWLPQKVPHFAPLRGYLPPELSRVATVWRSTKPPHEPVVSPGQVVASSVEGCTVCGTVSTTGSSGAPVIDIFGDHVVGIHLTSNMRDGSRVSGFLPARKLVFLLAEMGVTCR